MVFQAYTEEQLLARLYAVATDGLRHQDYERTLAVAHWCNIMMTGDDQHEILVQYKRRETEEQQSQRIKITNTRTQYVCNKVYNLFSEVHRADRTANALSYPQGQEQADSLLQNVLAFHMGDSLERYMDGLYKQANFYDPNSWLVVEFDNADPLNQKPTAYPYEVSARQAVDFAYVRGVLQYLTTHHSHSVKLPGKQEMATINTYTQYAAGYSYRLVVYPDAALVPDMEEEGMEVQPVLIGEDQHFAVLERFENGLQFVPATRLGYLKDPGTHWRTFVSPLWPAEKLLTELIWKKSEYDLAHALHGFYQKFIYVDDCPKCNGTGQVDHRNHGLIQCMACEGTGMNSHTSTQDVIEIIRVASKEEHIPLDQMVHYEQIPMDLIRQQKEDVRDLERDVFNAVFGSNVLDRSEVAVTATEKNYDWRMVNNTLLPYADGYASTYRRLVFTIASIRQEASGLVIEYAFPGDFNLESVDQMLQRRQSAVAAQAPNAVKQAIDAQILMKQHPDNPAAVQAYKARNEHQPMRDKSEQERQVAINLLPQLDPVRVLYLYFDEILDNVMLNTPTFPLLPYGQRRELVQEETGRKVAELEATSPQLLGGGGLPPMAE